jgi:hypothetical protein
MDHLFNLRIIVEECRDNKTDLFCCFIEFRKQIDIVCRTSFWNRLEDIKVPFKLRGFVTRLYENVFSKFRNIDGSEEINCNIRVKHDCPLSPTLFGLYIVKLEECLEEAGCVTQLLLV